MKHTAMAGLINKARQIRLRLPGKRRKNGFNPAISCLHPTAALLLAVFCGSGISPLCPAALAVHAAQPEQQAAERSVLALEIPPENGEIELSFPEDAQGGTISISRLDFDVKDDQLEDQKVIDQALAALPQASVMTGPIQDSRAVFSQLTYGTYLVSQPEACNGYRVIDPFLIRLDSKQKLIDAKPKMARNNTPAQSQTQPAQSQPASQQKTSKPEPGMSPANNRQTEPAAAQNRTAQNRQASVGTAQNSGLVLWSTLAGAALSAGFLSIFRTGQKSRKS